MRLFLQTLFFVWIAYMSPHSVAGQVQLGSSLFGEYSEDYFGRNVAVNANGSRVVAGSYGSDGAFTEGGEVRVFEYDGTDWLQVGQNIFGSKANEQFGYQVSISANGSRIAANAEIGTSDSTLIKYGIVRVFQFENNTWAQLGQDLQGGTIDGWYGWSFQLSGDGNRLIIGSPLNSEAGTYTGIVQVYEFTGQKWMQLGSDLHNFTPTPGFDQYGWAVDISFTGDTIATSALDDTENGFGSGRVTTLHFVNDQWEVFGNPIQGTMASEQTGNALSLSENGQKLAVGTRRSDIAGPNRGTTRVYELQGQEWVQYGGDIHGLTDNEYSGWYISLSGDGQKLAVGTPNYSVINPQAGIGRIYQVLNGMWAQVGSSIEGVDSVDLLGSLALSADGATLVIGAFRDDTEGFDAGMVSVYDVQDISAIRNANSPKQLVFSPNPSKDNIRIDRTFENTDDLILNIIDIHGFCIKRYFGYQKSYDIHSIPSGIYVLTLQTSHEVFTGKIIKI